MGPFFPRKILFFGGVLGLGLELALSALNSECRPFCTAIKIRSNKAFFDELYTWYVTYRRNVNYRLRWNFQKCSPHGNDNHHKELSNLVQIPFKANPSTKEGEGISIKEAEVDITIFPLITTIIQLEVHWTSLRIEHIT